MVVGGHGSPWPPCSYTYVVDITGTAGLSSVDAIVHGTYGVCDLRARIDELGLMTSVCNRMLQRLHGHC